MIILKKEFDYVYFPSLKSSCGSSDMLPRSPSEPSTHFQVPVGLGANRTQLRDFPGVALSQTAVLPEVIPTGTATPMTSQCRNISLTTSALVGTNLRDHLSSICGICHAVHFFLLPTPASSIPLLKFNLQTHPKKTPCKKSLSEHLLPGDLI